MTHVWDTFDTYRLNQVDLQHFLEGKFGTYDFHISVKNGNYVFYIPRLLTEDERNEILGLRYTLP